MKTQIQELKNLKTITMRKKSILKNTLVVAVAILTLFGAASCKKDSTTGYTCTCKNGFSIPVIDVPDKTKEEECQIVATTQSTTCSIK